MGFRANLDSFRPGAFFSKLSCRDFFLTLRQDEMDIENMVNEVQAAEPMDTINETNGNTATDQKFMSKVAVSRS